MKTTLTMVLTTFLAVGSAKPLHQARDQTTPAAVVAARTAPARSGKMTFYSPGQGACGVTNVDNDMVVAISPSLYGTYANPNASPMCQKTANITCPGGKTIKAAVRDRCMGCGAGDIDVSPAVFKVCGSLDLGKMAVGWDIN